MFQQAPRQRQWRQAWCQEAVSSFYCRFPWTIGATLTSNAWGTDGKCQNTVFVPSSRQTMAPHGTSNDEDVSRRNAGAAGRAAARLVVAVLLHGEKPAAGINCLPMMS
jgi:hypothetical protein